ncbi:UPF0182 family protein [Candidatus Poribacteria bacterium]|nr:UPF0182 family protein [Candidatus Poribacteria bacterium]
MGKTDLAIIQIAIGLIIAALALVAGILMYRHGKKTREPRLKVQAYGVWLGGGLIMSILFWPALVYLYTEHLWFEDVGYANVFWKLLKTRWGLFAKFGLVATGFMGANLFVGDRLCPVSREFARWTRERTVRFYRSLLISIVLVAGLLSVPMMFLWDDFLRYENHVLTGITEPVFQKDLSFYLFSLPVYRWVSVWVKVLLWATLLFVGLLYNFYHRRDPQTMTMVERRLVFHASVLWLMLLGVSLWRSQINIWNLLYAARSPWGLGRVDGMGYIDSHLIGAYQIYRLCVGLIGVVILINLFWQKRTVWYSAIVMWGASYLILIQIYPVVLHWTKVRPNPLSAETPFLKQHIESTRQAFGLDKDHLEKRDQIKGAATLEMINRNLEVKENIQLWDRRVLYEVLRDQQRIEPYYDFNPYTDVDRYWVGGKYRQVLIAAREVDAKELKEARDWVSQKLMYTHGYGVCVVPVNEFQKENSNPNFWVKGIIPVKNTYPEFALTQPQIYYGELTKDYVIVNTNRKQLLFSTKPEFQTDLDNGNLSEGLRQSFKEHEITLSQNVTLSMKEKGSKWLITDEDNKDKDNKQEYTVSKEKGQLNIYKKQKEIDPEGKEYKGSGGVKIDDWFKRLCFATRFDFWRVLLSPGLTSESKVLFWRKIGTRQPDSAKTVTDRISHIAPFLKYDPDPYIVIADGQLWWIVDIYVTSRSYPNSKTYVDKTHLIENPLYSEPTFDHFRYIRNPAVAVVNAYSGEVNFYWTKSSEPIMTAYQNAFPKLFKRKDDMPAELRNHLRYPDYLTRIQAEMYTDYHQDAQSFYLGSERWHIPQEKYYSAWQTMVPYYAILKLPEEKEPEFVNMIPFTPPTQVRYMNAWLVARSDLEHYGQLVVYSLPQSETIIGPMQVEGDIETKLSEKLTLWNQQGTTVIRGNLLVIPVENTLFYVEPIYLKPEGINRPNLVTVVVVAGDKFASADTFHEALQKIFGVGIGVESPKEAAKEGSATLPTLTELIKLANDNYNQYLKLTGEGKITEAAQALMELEKALKALKAGQYQIEAKKT